MGRNELAAGGLHLHPASLLYTSAPETVDRYWGGMKTWERAGNQKFLHFAAKMAAIQAVLGKTQARPSTLSPPVMLNQKAGMKKIVTVHTLRKKKA